MLVPILKHGDYLIASIQSELSDADLLKLREGLVRWVSELHSRGVIVDITALDAMNSFATYTFRPMAQMAMLCRAETIMVGIQPEIAISIVQQGLKLDCVSTALEEHRTKGNKR